MKKLIVSTCLTLMITVGPMKKAEASIVVTTAGAIGSIIATVNDNETLSFGAGLMLVGGPLYCGISYWIFKASRIGSGWHTFGKIFLILDTNGNLPQEQLEEALNTNYPFINNQTVIHHLAANLKRKYQETKMNMVSLSENETKKILSAVDLSEEEIQLVADGLK